MTELAECATRDMRAFYARAGGRSGGADDTEASGGRAGANHSSGFGAEQPVISGRDVVTLHAGWRGNVGIAWFRTKGEAFHAIAARVVFSMRAGRGGAEQPQVTVDSCNMQRSLGGAGADADIATAKRQQ